MMHNFISLLKHDVFEGVFHKWKYFLVAVLFFSFVDFIFINKANSLFISYNVDLKCSVSDLLLNMFIGNEPFDLETKRSVSLSLTWFLFHSLLFSFIGFYITDDLKKNTTSFILRVKSKKQWWTSKVVWCVLTVIIYYTLFFIIALIFAAFFGKVSFNASNLIASELFEINISGIDVFDIIFTSLLLPMIISVPIALFEAVLNLILKPVYGFLIIICYLAASAFYCSVYLLFNFSMVIRNNFYGVNGVANQYGVLTAVCLAAACYLIGAVFIKRKDIL